MNIEQNDSRHIKFSIENNEVLIRSEKKYFKQNIDDFIVAYINENPLRSDEQVKKVITRHQYDEIDNDVEQLILIWKIPIIDEELQFAIPHDEFETNLDECNDKEKIVYCIDKLKELDAKLLEIDKTLELLYKRMDIYHKHSLQ